MKKTAVLAIVGAVCVAAAAVGAVFGARALLRYRTRGDASLLENPAQASFCAQFTPVRSYPRSKKQGRAWRDGMIGGNGRLGFVTSGDPYHDSILFQDVDYIMPTPHERTTLPDLYEDLETARQAIVSLDDSFEARGCGDWNYGYAFHPGQALRITQSAQSFRDYLRWTDYATGEVGVTYCDKGGVWRRTTFTSLTDDVTITAITKSDAGEKLNLTLSLDDAGGLFKFGEGDERNMQYRKLVTEDASAIAFAAHYPDYEESPLKDGGYAGVTYVLTIGGSKEKVSLPADSRRGDRDDPNVGEANPGVQIKDAEAIYLITKNDRTASMGALEDFAAQEKIDLVETLLAACKAVSETYTQNGAFDYTAALAPSAEAYAAQFGNTALDCGATEADRLKPNETLLRMQHRSKTPVPALIERLYLQGRHAMVCASGYSMTRLSGMWTGEWMPGWRSEYTMDANVNLQSSGMNTSNLPLFGEGYIKFILRQIDDWKTNAAQCYAMENAIKAPVNCDGDGALDAEYAHSYPFQYWNAGASWMIQPIYEYRQCFGNRTITGDNGEALRLEEDILLPLLELQSNFWLQFVDPQYYTDKNGNLCYEAGKTALLPGETYAILPSYSPENTTGGKTYQSTLAANAAIDIAAARSGLRMTIDLLESVKPENWEARKAELQDLLDHLPPYLTDESGAIKEWCANQFEENNRHRHISHLYLAWPEFETQHDEALYAAAKQAVENREKENSASHGFVHQALVYARLKESDQVERLLTGLLSDGLCYDSLMTDHNTNRGSNTYCTDALLGLQGILDEALLFSNSGEIELLPAKPQSWKTGEVKDLRARTGATVSVRWDEAGVSASITSDKAQKIAVSCMGGAPQTIAFAAGETKTVRF